MKKLFVLSLLFVVAACTSNQQSDDADLPLEEQSLTDRINTMLDADQYIESIEILKNEEDSEEVIQLREKAYLNFGLYLEYRDSNVTNMRDKMNGALRQYIEVMKINPDNEKAITEIEQILGIYSTFPDRSPDPDIMTQLEELGF